MPEGVEVIYAKAEDDLGEMLPAGEIDALISADAPRRPYGVAKGLSKRRWTIEEVLVPALRDS